MQDRTTEGTTRTSNTFVSRNHHPLWCSDFKPHHKTTRKMGRTSQRSMPMVPIPGAPAPVSRRQRSGGHRNDARMEDRAKESHDFQESADSDRSLRKSRSDVVDGERYSMASSGRQGSSTSSSVGDYKKRYENSIKRSHSDRSILSNAKNRSDEDRGRSRAHKAAGNGTRSRSKSRQRSPQRERVSSQSYKRDDQDFKAKDTKSRSYSADGNLSSEFKDDWRHDLESAKSRDDQEGRNSYSQRTRSGESRNSTKHRTRRSSAEDRTVTSKSTRDSGTGGTGYRTRTSGGTGSRASGVRTSVTRTSLLSHQEGESVCFANAQTIALLGASGMTGSRFLYSALDAGYNVRCLPSDDPRQTPGKAPWKILKAEMEDTQQLEILLNEASYVVVMINDLLPRRNSEYPVLFLSKLVCKLYVMMRRQESMQVFLLQATSLASDITGRTPVFSKVVKTTTRRRDQFMLDLDAVMKRIATEHGLRTSTNNNDENQNPKAPHFSFLVTRPTILLQNGPGCKRLFASKSVRLYL